MEKCFLEATQQLSFKYFMNFCLIPKLLSKVLEKQTILSKGNLSVIGLRLLIPFMPGFLLDRVIMTCYTYANISNTQNSRRKIFDL